MAEGGSGRESDWSRDYGGDGGDRGGFDVEVVDSQVDTTSDDCTTNDLYDSSEDENSGWDTGRRNRRRQELDKEKCDIEAAMREIKLEKAQMERALEIEIVKRMEALRMETDQDVSTDRSRGSRTKTSKSPSAVKRKKNLERDRSKLEAMKDEVKILEERLEIESERRPRRHRETKERSSKRRERHQRRPVVRQSTHPKEVRVRCESPLSLPESSKPTRKPVRKEKVEVGRTTNRREVEPPKFDGKGPWKDFILQFDACRTFNHWTDSEAAIRLYTSCKGDALSTLSVNDVLPGDLSYNEMVMMMVKEFGPRQCVENYFMELNNKEQQIGESLHDLGKDIKRLVALAHPRTDRVERDRIAREHYKRAIADPELRKELFRSAPETLDDAIMKAEIVDSFSKSEQARRRSKYVAHSRAVEASTDIEDLEARMKSSFGALEQHMLNELANMRSSGQVCMVQGNADQPRTLSSFADGGRGPPRGPPICYTCNMPGHIARFCDQQGSSGSSQSRRSTVCYLCGVEGHMARSCRMQGQARSVTCYTCGEPGHISPYCPHKEQGNELVPPMRPSGRQDETKGQNTSKNPSQNPSQRQNLVQSTSSTSGH